MGSGAGNLAKLGDREISKSGAGLEVKLHSIIPFILAVAITFIG